MSRARQVLDTEQLLLAFEVTEEEIERAVEPGRVYAMTDMRGRVGGSRYRLDWVWEHSDGSVAASFTLLDGIGGALCGLDGVLAAEWKGKDRWPLTKPSPQCGAEPFASWREAKAAGATTGW